MIDFKKRLLQVSAFASTIIIVFNSEATADKIGGSNLPSPTPALKGRITEDGQAMSAVVTAGLVLTAGKATISLAASETWRTYDTLELIGLARDDRKFEMALAGEMPLTKTVSLNGRIDYLDYRSSFGDVGTDALSASLGLTYAATQ